LPDWRGPSTVTIGYSRAAASISRVISLSIMPLQNLCGSQVQVSFCTPGIDGQNRMPSMPLRAPGRASTIRRSRTATRSAPVRQDDAGPVSRPVVLQPGGARGADPAGCPMGGGGLRRRTGGA
jgi:hypothetical protein